MNYLSSGGDPGGQRGQLTPHFWERGVCCMILTPHFFAEIVVYNSPKISVSQLNVSATGDLSRIPVKFCLQDTF